MKEFFEKLKQQVAENPPNYGNADSVLGLLYECFNENNPYDNEQIKADFEELYRQMNGCRCGRWIKSYTRFASSAGIMKGQDLWRVSKLVVCYR